jgi:hypothetical protein
MADSTQQQPTFWSGLMAGLNNTASNPLTNIGLGLMSAAKPFGNVGDSLMNANQQTLQNRGMQQQQAIQSYGLARQKEMWPAYKAIADQIAGRFGAGNMSAGTSMAPPGTPPVPTQAPNRYDPLPPLPPISPNPGGDLQLGAAAKSLGMPSPFPEPKDVETALAVQQKQRQQAVAPQLSDLDTIMTSPDADKRLAKDGDLKSLWDQEQGGQPLTPPAARAYAGTVYNRLAGSAQAAVKPIPTQLVDQPGPLGQVRQRDPLTNKLEISAPSQPLTSVAGPGGAPILTPAGQAAGKAPFNEQIYAANQISPSTLEQNYQQWKATGKPPANASRNVLANATQANYIAKRAAEDNIANPGQRAAAQQQAYEAQAGVVKDFTDPGGKAGGSLVAINTAVAHLTGLYPLIDAMQSGNMTLTNRLRQEYQRQNGVPAPTNYQALATMAAAEASKAVFAAGGGEGERDEVAAPFKSANGPDALKGAVQTVSTALAGKTEALRNAWDTGTAGSQGPFDRFLMPQTKKALGIAQPPSVNGQGWKLHKDSKGNQAYVSPDGKQFQEVP